MITRVRLIGLRYSTPIVDIPLSDPRLRQLQLSMEPGDTLLIAFNASLFHPVWSGTIGYRFRTPSAQRILELIQEQTG